MPQALACKGNKRDCAHDAEQRDEQVHRLLQLRKGEGLILRLRQGCVVEHDAADHKAHGRGDVQDIRQLSAGKDLLPARLAAQRPDQNGQRSQHGHAQHGDDEIEVTPRQDGTVAFDIVAELHPAQDRCEHGCAAGDAEQCGCTGGPESLHGNGLPFKH